MTQVGTLLVVFAAVCIVFGAISVASHSFKLNHIKAKTVGDGLGHVDRALTAEQLSQALGKQTVQSGSVSQSKNEPSRSLQMIERALMTPDELKSIPKGTFVVMKTGTHPMQSRLRLFFKWGIVFPDALYEVEDKGNRAVAYARKDVLEAKIAELYPQKKDEDPPPTSGASEADRRGMQLQKPKQRGEANERIRDDLSG